MFREKILPNVDKAQRVELRKSWKTRGYIIKFEDELVPKTEEELAAEALAADELRVASIAAAEADEDKPVVVEDPNAIVVKEPEVIENKEPDANVSLLCPHCGSTARTQASFDKNHGDNCFRKKD